MKRKGVITSCQNTQTYLSLSVLEIWRLATGGSATMPNWLKNCNHENVMTAWEVLLSEKPVGRNILTNTEVTGISEDSIKCNCQGGKMSLEGVDTIIYAIGTTQNTKLAEELEEMDIPFEIIGDAKEVRRIFNAVIEGREIALEI